MINYGKLAEYYAPVFAQKIHEEWPAADQIAPVNLTGSITQVFDNPTFLASKPAEWVIPNPVAYYSVCETTTHYFIIYMVYHPLDWWKRVEPSYFADPYNWVRRKLDQHVHDMEGVLMVLSKERHKRNLPPRLDAIITVSHFDFYLFAQPQIWHEASDSWADVYPDMRRVVNFKESVDGRIEFDTLTGRAKLYIEAMGHGIRADKKSWNAGKQIWWYNPCCVKHICDPDGEEPDVPDAKIVFGKARPENVRAYYELEDMFLSDGLWTYRYDDRVFIQRENGQWAVVGRGWIDDTTGHPQRLPGSANPPWSWNDHNDTTPIGEIATDPARFIINYGQGWGAVSTHYIYNPYQNIDLRRQPR